MTIDMTQELLAQATADRPLTRTTGPSFVRTPIQTMSFAAMALAAFAGAQLLAEMGGLDMAAGAGAAAATALAV